MSNSIDIQYEEFQRNIGSMQQVYDIATSKDDNIYAGINDSEEAKVVSKCIYDEIFKRYKNDERVFHEVLRYKKDIHSILVEYNIQDKTDVSRLMFMQYEDYNDIREVIDMELKENDKSLYLYADLLLYSLERSNLSRRSNLMLRMSYVYLHTIMDEFLSDCIRDLSYSHLKMLGNKKLSYSDILECSSLGEIFELMVDRNVNELAYGSFEDKVTFFRNKGINIRNELEDELILFSEIRNSVTHSRLKVNEKIVNKLKATKYKKEFSVGDQFAINEIELNKYIDLVKELCGFLFGEVLRIAYE